MQAITVKGDAIPDTGVITLKSADLKQAALDLEEVLSMGPVMAHLGDNRNLHDLLEVLKVMTGPFPGSYPPASELTQ